MESPQEKIDRLRRSIDRRERKLVSLADGTWDEPPSFEDIAAFELAAELLGISAAEVWRIARTWEICTDLVAARTRLNRLEQGS